MLFSASLAAAFIASAAAAAVPEWNQWAHGRVLVNNITMHYRWAGSGPPILLVHGNPQPSVSFPSPYLTKFVFFNGLQLTTAQ